MPFSYQIHPGQNLVVNTIQGHFNFSDYLTLMERILNDPRFQPAMHMFWDFLDSTLVEFTSDDFEKIRSYIQQNRARRGSGYRAVFLVSKDVDYGLSRMYQIISEELPVQFEVFRDREAALAWIGAADEK
jgi:hypothetical protein